MHHIQLIQIHTNTTTTKNNLHLCNTSGANLIPWTFLPRYCHIVKHYDYCWNFLQSFDAGTKVLVHQHAFSYNVTKTNNFYIFFGWCAGKRRLIWNNQYQYYCVTLLLSEQIYCFSWKQSNKCKMYNILCLWKNAGKEFVSNQCTAVSNLRDYSTSLLCLSYVIIYHFPLTCSLHLSSTAVQLSNQRNVNNLLLQGF